MQGISRCAQHGCAVFAACALSHGQNAEEASAAAAFFQLGNQAGGVKFNFGNQNHISAARHAGHKGDPTGLAAHQLQHHHAMMALRGRMQAVGGFGGGCHGGVEAKGHIGAAHVVINCFWDAHNRCAARKQVLADAQCAVAAQHQQRIQF